MIHPFDATAAAAVAAATTTTFEARANRTAFVLNVDDKLRKEIHGYCN